MISHKKNRPHYIIAIIGVLIGLAIPYRPFTTFIQHIADERISEQVPSGFVHASSKIKPSVVAVVVEKEKSISQNQNDIQFNDNFTPTQYEESINSQRVHSMGSGIVIDTFGNIVTSNHIVNGAEKITITLHSGHAYQASIVGGDSLSDLAVIRIDSGKIHYSPAEFVTKDSLSVGEFVLAVGNPFLNFFNSADPTVTQGIVSALHRNFRFTGTGIYQDMIQTDAAINPGNSGGPLVNAYGEVAGINSFIYTGNGDIQGSVGIGFAIPGSRAHHIAEELINHGRRRIAWTGLKIGEEQGIIITNVTPEGPGDNAGIEINDRIVQIADRQIHSASDIIGVFLPYFPEDTLDIVIERSNVRIKTKLVLVEME